MGLSLKEILGGASITGWKQMETLKQAEKKYSGIIRGLPC